MHRGSHAVCRDMEEIIVQGSHPAPDGEVLRFDTIYARSVLEQYRVCVWKFNITYWRTPNYNATRFSFSVAVGLIFGACFWQLGGRSDNEQGIYNTLGALLTSTLFLGILNSIFVQPVVSAERAVFYRERAAGMYSAGPWYLALVRPCPHAVYVPFAHSRMLFTLSLDLASIELGKHRNSEPSRNKQMYD